MNDVDAALRDPSTVISKFPPLHSVKDKQGRLVHSLPRMAVPFTPANSQQMEYIQSSAEHLFLYGDRGGG